MLKIWLLIAPVVMIGLIPPQTLAADTGGVVAVLADYGDLKERVGRIKRARAEGYTIESRTMHGLIKECNTLSFEAKKLALKMMMADPELRRAKGQVVLAGIQRACGAMQQYLYALVDYDRLQAKEFLTLASKHEESWILADELVGANGKP